MPTLMTRSTFDMLSDVASRLATTTDGYEPGPSAIFVPWAGQRLKTEFRGIYYFGIAADPRGERYGAQSFENRILNTEKFCTDLLHNTTNTPFWRFLGQITKQVLGGSIEQTKQYWGWSNLLKIAWTKDGPRDWPKTFCNSQLSACRAAFREEITSLRNSLIVIASENEYGMLYKGIADKSQWNTEKENAYFFHDPRAGNLFAHCYHPRSMMQRGMAEATVTDIVNKVRERLPAF